MSKKSKFARKKKEFVLGEDASLEQLDLLMDRYGIDVDEMEGDIKVATEHTLNNVLKGVREGFIDIFEDAGQVKVKQIIEHPSKEGTVKELVYGELKMSDHTSMRDGKDITQYDKMEDLLISMCETDNAEIYIPQLRSKDAKRGQNLALLFL